MVNAQFCIVDPSQGHDCSVDAGRPQWRLSDTVSASDGQRSSAHVHHTLSSSLRGKEPTRFFGPVTYDASGHATYASKLHKGVTFTLYYSHQQTGKRHQLYCKDCWGICYGFKDDLKPLGIMRRAAIVLNGEFVDVDPDEAGTNKGHLCRQPDLASETASVGTDGADISHGHVVAKGGSDGSRTQRGVRSRRPSVLKGANDDSGYGNAIVLSPSCLTEVEKSVLGVMGGSMLGKELVAYRSKQHRRLFKFVLSDSSSPEKSALDFYCLDCRIKHEQECRVTVRQGKFVITDPDLTSAGAHYCVAAGSDSSKTTSRKRAATFELSAPPSVHTATSVKISVANGEPIAKRPRTQDAAKPPLGQQVNEPSEGNRGPTACRVTAPDASEQKPPNPLGSSGRLSEHSRRSFTNSATSISNDFYSEPSLAKRPKQEPQEVVTLSDSDDERTEENRPSVHHSSRTSSVKQENNADADARPSLDDSVVRFHRFLRDHRLTEDYARWSINSAGDPAVYIQRIDIMPQWIAFNKRQ